MVVTSDDGLAERLRLLRKHGGKPKYFHQIVGGNFRLDTIQAAVLRVKLRHLDAWHEARQKHADRYRELFRQAGLAGTVALPAVVDATPGIRSHIYNQFVIRIPKRDALREHLTAQGIGTEVYYPVPFHLQECFRDLGYKAGDFPESERAARETAGAAGVPRADAGAAGVRGGSHRCVPPGAVRWTCAGGGSW